MGENAKIHCKLFETSLMIEILALATVLRFIYCETMNRKKIGETLYMELVSLIQRKKGDFCANEHVSWESEKSGFERIVTN